MLLSSKTLRKNNWFYGDQQIPIDLRLLWMSLWRPVPLVLCWIPLDGVKLVVRMRQHPRPHATWTPCCSPCSTSLSSAWPFTSLPPGWLGKHGYQMIPGNLARETSGCQLLVNCYSRYSFGSLFVSFSFIFLIIIHRLEEELASVVYVL